MGELIPRDWVLKNLLFDVDRDVVRAAPSVDAEPVITGETSDEYHTFNELYHHRAVLFSVIVKAFEDKAWKSKKHHDGTMYDGMFIVGIETPDGQATYHYDIEPYWDMFSCKEVESAPEWDGHTPAQAIERIGKLEPVKYSRIIMTKDGGMESLVYNGSCKNCFAKVDVVRCKECRYNRNGICEQIEYIMDGYYHGTFEEKRPDDFCSYGEKMDGGADDD